MQSWSRSWPFGGQAGSLPVPVDWCFGKGLCLPSNRWQFWRLPAFEQDAFSSNRYLALSVTTPHSGDVKIWSAHASKMRQGRGQDKLLHKGADVLTRSPCRAGAVHIDMG